MSTSTAQRPQGELPLTVPEVAERLRVHRCTVQRLLARGVLRALPGIRHRRIMPAELERYLRQGGAEG